MSSSSGPAISSPPEQLHYVHCHPCGTILGVCVPRTSLGSTLTVRCGNCSKLLSVDTHGSAFANHLRLPLRHLPRSSHLLLLGALYRSHSKSKMRNLIDDFCLSSREIDIDD